MMKRILFLISLLLVTGCLLVRAQVYKFDFTSDKKVKEGYTKVTLRRRFGWPRLSGRHADTGTTGGTQAAGSSIT